MSYFEAIILGLVQGLTEFIPISSSGHLVLSRAVFGIEKPGLFFDVVLHFGTLLAVLIFFRQDLLKIIKNFKNYNKPVWLLLAGTIPAFIVGYFASDYLEKIEDRPRVVAFFLILTGLILIFAEYFYKKKNPQKLKNEKQISFQDAISVGLAQALALLPGVSRSGMTISMGLFRSIKREDSAKFSFLLSIPAILGAGAYSLFSQVTKDGKVAFELYYIIGFFVAFVSGYLAIKFLLSFLKNNSLTFFAGYLLFIGFGLILYLALKS